jgi:hypothetical protein
MFFFRFSDCLKSNQMSNNSMFFFRFSDCLKSNQMSNNSMFFFRFSDCLKSDQMSNNSMFFLDLSIGQNSIRLECKLIQQFSHCYCLALAFWALAS